MKKTAILATGKIIDGHGSLGAVTSSLAILRRNGFTVKNMILDPLRAGWNTPLEPDHFRSGCSPITALYESNILISNNNFDAVLISGTDHLKSDYTREERIDMMNIYPDDFTIPEGYTALAQKFMEYNGIDKQLFRTVSARLFANYLLTYNKYGHSAVTSPRWKEHITDLFLMCDCANPAIDFDGMLLVGNSKCTETLDLSEPVYIAGIGLGETTGDGKQYIDEIAKFEHLKSAYNKACSDAGIDFKNLFLAGEALLEVYTCYPVIPLAFLLTTGIATSPLEIETILDRFEITITGGMNLAKAPWDNPALSALITAHEKMQTGRIDTACIHGNGGLGYKQGVAILQKQFIQLF